jgi:hypothetical protein
MNNTQNVDKFAKVHVNDVAPCTSPVQKKFPVIDRRANFQSRNNANTLMTITTIHVMSNTEFAMIQTFTNSGFSWGQKEDAVKNCNILQ